MFVHSCAATPNYLLEALAKHGKNNNLRDVELIHIPTVGPAIYNNPEYEGEPSHVDRQQIFLPLAIFTLMEQSDLGPHCLP